jgi:hypothetical protein
MSYQSDAIHAFSGIMARLRPLLQGEFIYGLPETELDIALLWQPHGTLTRNVDPVAGKALFPSWSWAGWVGSNGRTPIWSQNIPSRVMWQDFTLSEGPNQYFSSEQCRSISIEDSASVDDWKVYHGLYFEDAHRQVLFTRPIAAQKDRTTRDGSDHPTLTF